MLSSDTMTAGMAVAFSPSATLSHPPRWYKDVPSERDAGQKSGNKVGSSIHVFIFGWKGRRVCAKTV